MNILNKIRKYLVVASEIECENENLKLPNKMRFYKVYNFLRDIALENNYEVKVAKQDNYKGNTYWLYLTCYDSGRRVKGMGIYCTLKFSTRVCFKDFIEVYKPKNLYWDK